MNKILLVIFLSFCINGITKAQSYTESFSACGKTYKITCEAQVDNSIKVSVKDGIKDSLLVTYQIWTSNMEVFANFFFQNFSDSSRVSDSCKTAEKTNLLSYGRTLLRNYLTTLQNVSPNAGIFKLKDSVFLYGYYRNKSAINTVSTVKKYKVLRLQAEIADGYLENIKAYLYNQKKIIVFTLPFPVGMSSVDNFKKYANSRLYDLGSSPFIKSTNSAHPDYFIKLSELIDYDYYLGIKRRDYSPKDTLLDLQSETSLVLHKEESKKLFEANIFTDFQGLNESKPNGLIQTELSKRININTTQYLASKWAYWLFGSYGYFQYIAPAITISKLEQHNRYLNLSDLDSVRLNPGQTDTSVFNKNYHRFTNALSLYQYQWFSFGTDLNLFYINNHERKFSVYFNAGIKLSFTDIVDSLTKASPLGISKTGFINQYTVNFLELYPEIRINFLPEERFCFSLSNRWIYLKPLSSTVQLVSFDKDNPLKMYPKSDKWLNVSELLMTIQVNPNSKLFAKGRLNWELGNIKNNFAQIQVGYSTYILGNK